MKPAPLPVIPGTTMKWSGLEVIELAGMAASREYRAKVRYPCCGKDEIMLFRWIRYKEKMAERRCQQARCYACSHAGKGEPRKFDDYGVTPPTWPVPPSLFGKPFKLR